MLQDHRDSGRQCFKPFRGSQVPNYGTCRVSTLPRNGAYVLFVDILSLSTWNLKVLDCAKRADAWEQLSDICLLQEKAWPKGFKYHHGPYKRTQT